MERCDPEKRDLGRPIRRWPGPLMFEDGTGEQVQPLQTMMMMRRNNIWNEKIAE
jgi:hypothetical protein